MKLSAERKNRLLEKAKLVYGKYLSLDFLKSHDFDINGKSQTLVSFLQALLKSQETKTTATINGQNYSIELIGQDGQFSLKLTQDIPEPRNIGIKPPKDYADDEILAQLTQQQFSLQVDEKNKVSVSNHLEGNLSIGGPGKIDLYRTHLVTLFNIIEKIESEEDVTHLLVALATGSGKTFVQALWMLVLNLAEFDAIFSVPDKLVAQFHQDMKVFLPEQLTDRILTLRHNQPSEEACEVLQSMSQDQGAGSNLILASSERLLDNHYQELNKLNPQRSFLSFDEQHLLTEVERRRVRLFEIADKVLSMFLTATPNEETYELCGKKPVAIMSSGQKEKAGQGRFPTTLTHYAKTLHEKLPFTTYNPFKKAFWETLGKRFMIWFYDAVLPEPTSAARSIAEELPYLMMPNSNGVQSHQVPIARKALVIIDDNESLVNFMDAMNYWALERKVYHNGNYVDRSRLAEFFGTYDVEHDVQKAYKDILTKMEYKKEWRRQIPRIIFHNLVEYVLKDLTGLSEIEHNQMRKNHPQEFIELVKQRFQERSEEYYFEKLKEKIDEQGATRVAYLLNSISEQLFSYKSDLNSDTFAQAVLNPGAYYASFCDSSIYRCNRLIKFCDTYGIIGLVSGMEHAETPIQDSKPFSSIEGERVKLYAESGMVNKKAKRRLIDNPFDRLDSDASEAHFKPFGLKGVTEEQCDQYFKLGFAAIYVSNKKTEGFSDPNLHTVIYATEKTASEGNHPEKLTQGLGRNRGLDETIEPLFIHALAHQQKSFFDFEHLKKEDYLPELFKSVHAYHRRYIAVIGEKISSDLMLWFEQNLDQSGKINQKRLKRQTLKLIASALRDINNTNHHQISLSRRQLKQLMSHAIKRLDREISYLESPNKLSFFVRCVGNFMNFLSECSYAWGRMKAAFKRYRYRWFQQKTTSNSVDHDAEKTYDKIIRKTNFKQLTTKTATLNMFKQWASQLKTLSEVKILQNPFKYLKESYSKDLKRHFEESLIPFLVKFVASDQVKHVERILRHDKKLLARLRSHQARIDNLGSEEPKEQELFVLQFLQEIPGLEYLTETDLAYYPQSIAALKENPWQAFFQGEDVQALLVERLVDYMQGEFQQHLTSFFTFPDAQNIKEKLEDRACLEVFAQDYLDTTIKNNSFDVKAFREKFAHHVGLPPLKTIDERATEAENVFREILEDLNQASDWFSKINKLNEQTPALAAHVRTHVLPVLAAFIDEDAKKRWFLDKTYHDQQLVGWLNRNQACFENAAAFESSDAHQLINQLLPEQEKLSFEAICDPSQKAEQSSQAVQMDIAKLSMQSALESDSCKDKMALLYTQNDHKKLWQAFQNEATRTTFLERVMSERPMQLENLFKKLQQVSPALADIRPMQIRIDDTKDFLDTLIQNKASALDGEKVKKALHHTFEPLLYHPKFYNVIKNLLGYLGENDMVTILKARNTSMAEEKARSLTLFVQAIKRKDKAFIESNYFDPKQQGEEILELENLPIIDVVHTLAELVEEIVDCHCYYNDHDRKGGSFSDDLPSLVKNASNTLKEIRINTTDSFVGRMSRTIFYLQGLRHGLSEVAQVSADTNRYKIEQLKEVRNNLLRPIQWRVNASSIKQACVDGMAKLGQLCKQIVSLSWQGIQYPFVKNNKAYAKKEEKRQQRGKEFQDSANSFAQVLNQLKPYDADKVHEQNCPKDAITGLKSLWKPARPEAEKGEMLSVVSSSSTSVSM